MKICPLGDDFFHADGQTDTLDETNGLDVWMSMKVSPLLTKEQS
jgi:hypothetical protein